MRWIAYLRVYGLYAGAEQKLTPRLIGRPVGILRGNRVLDLSLEAARSGVTIGSKIRQAQQDCPEITLVRFEEARYREFVRAPLEICAGFTPQVESVTGYEIFLDLSGPREPRALLEEILHKIVPGLGFTARVGVSTSKLVAQAAALAGGTSFCPGAADGRRNSRDSGAGGPVIAGGPVNVPPGGEVAFLARLPVDYLFPLPTGVREGLMKRGLRTIADVARVPEKELFRQFGPAARAIFEYARGIDRRSVLPLYPPRRLEKCVRFESEVSSRLALEAALRSVVGDISRRLIETGEGCLTLTLELEMARGSVGEREPEYGSIGQSGPVCPRAGSPYAVRLLDQRRFSKPKNEASVIRTALGILLDRFLAGTGECGRPLQEPGGGCAKLRHPGGDPAVFRGITGLKVIAGELRPMLTVQQNFFAEGEETAQEGERLERVIQAISSRYPREVLKFGKALTVTRREEMLKLVDPFRFDSGSRRAH